MKAEEDVINKCWWRGEEGIYVPGPIGFPFKYTAIQQVGSTSLSRLSIAATGTSIKKERKKAKKERKGKEKKRRATEEGE